jgi:hypothetical protein
VEPRLLGCCRVGRQGVSPACLDLLLTFFLLLSVSSRAEPAGPLLVHLRPRGHSIDGEVDELLGFNQVYDLVRVRVDVPEDFLFARRLGPVLWVSAGMDDAVHVEIQIVHCWVVRFDLRCNHIFVLVQALVLSSLLVGRFLIKIKVNFIFIFLSFVGLVLHFKKLDIVFAQCVNDDLRVADGQPPEECWNAH